jgi:hypothetical protein
MKKKLSSQSAFSSLRFLIGLALCLTGGFLALLGLGRYPSAWAQGPKQNQTEVGVPQVVPMAGPVSQDQDLRTLPYIAPNPEVEELRLTRYPLSQIQSHGTTDPVRAVRQPDQAAAMPTPIATFAGMNSTQSGCNCLPPDPHGDVGPSHYVQAVNSSFKIFDKAGNPLNGTNGTTFNSFFAPLTGTPCGASQNHGDPFVFYDHLADRWVVSDFAFPAFPGTSFWQCIGVSQSSDPVAGGWFLYAVQVDPANTNRLGDYPKMALWNNPAPGGAYYLTMNEFSNTTTFNGVRVYTLDRGSMINGGAPNAIGFTITPTGLGDSYSLVPATFRAGSAPPAGRDEFLISVDSPSSGGVTLTQVHGWRFHVDFQTPGNSTLGVGVDHTPNAQVTVNGFVDAFTTTSNLVPQNVTTVKLDTLGDKIMTPLVYQNRNGTESLWASQTVILNYPNGPTAVRWYQFDVTGSNLPAAPAQQQTFSNAADGLWRWMPSISVDAQGNMAIGYSVSSSTSEPSIRYAGRLAGDSLNSLAQGEALLIAGGGYQTHSSGRWGDYSGMSIDPSDNLTFWHTNEYFSATSIAGWNTRIGKFKFPSALPPLTSVASRMTHTGVGDFDINLPLPPNASPRAVECRSSGASNDYHLVFSFANNLSSVGGASVTGHDPMGGTGTVNGSPIVGPNVALGLTANQCAVNLTNVSNVQYITVTLTGVVDMPGNSGDVVSPHLGILVGDVNATGGVDGNDVSAVQSHTRQTVDATTFQFDVNTTGAIDGNDVSATQSKTRTSLPSLP